MRATYGQEAESVGGHGELVESVEAAQLPGDVAQLVVVCGQILQGHTVVQAVWETHELVHGHIQSLQLLQVTDLWRFNTDTQQRVRHASVSACERISEDKGQKDHSYLNKGASLDVIVTV